MSPRSEAGKFVYAVARDGTVRVVDLDREQECETNPSPRLRTDTLDLQQTLKPGSFTYFRVEPEIRGYMPLGKYGVLAARAHDDVGKPRQLTPPLTNQVA